MDSWYILHPLLNLARLAERDNDQAREQFLKSLDVQIKIAHHFKYQWPVFYDVDTLEIIKAEVEPGKGGELDVPGLYAHVLIQAFELTDDQRYLDEAMAASDALRDKGFELAYQLNNVVFGMTAMNRLAAITGDKGFLEISRVLCACLFDNVGLWSMRYGHSRNNSSFFGVFPMPTAPYTAAYEDAEVAAAALDYLRCPGDGLFAPLAVLLPEMLRHVTARLDTYYPANIVPDAVTESPKTGHIAPELKIPVEDLGDGWEKVGTVGQEVYGAGIAFSTLVRSYIRVPDRGEQIYCEYPWSMLSATRDRVEMKVHGDPRLQCRVRVLAEEEGGVHLERVVGSNSGELSAVGQGPDWCDFWVPGGQDVEFTFS